MLSIYDYSSQKRDINIGYYSRRLQEAAATAAAATDPPKRKDMAPIFFQASLLPYLLFLYFLNYRGNRTPKLANFGFQFLLLFVVATAVAAVMAQEMFDASLANVDWIHGSAESLLTISNVLIVVGFKDTMTRSYPAMIPGVFIAEAATVFLVAFVVLGAVKGFEQHTHFLLGIGDISQSLLPWAVRREPLNALSIATWTIHLMSVIEYVVAMNLVWRYAETTRNPRWKGLTWGMLPMHASSICAVTHHFFYNNDNLLFLVTWQGFLTFFGNCTTMIAAYRIAKSNGWRATRHTLCCCTRRQGVQQEYQESRQPLLNLSDGPSSNSLLLAKLICFTVMVAYVIKYGELAFMFPAQADSSAAVAMVFGIPLVTAAYYAVLSFLVEDDPQFSPSITNHDDDDNSEDFYTSREQDDGLIINEASPLIV